MDRNGNSIELTAFCGVSVYRKCYMDAMCKDNEVTCILHKLLNDPLPCTVIAMACSKGKFINFNMTGGMKILGGGGGGSENL